MKKIFLMVVAVLSMTTVFAENENTENVAVVNTYDMSVNMRKLGGVLGLTTDQMETVSNIHRTFCGEMMIASQAHNDDRKTLVKEAVAKDLKYMAYVLTPAQMHTYELLLNTTLENRGLKD